MSSAKIGSSKEGQKISQMSVETLEKKLKNSNTRGPDRERIRKELIKRSK